MGENRFFFDLLLDVRSHREGGKRERTASTPAQCPSVCVCCIGDDVFTISLYANEFLSHFVDTHTYTRRALIHARAIYSFFFSSFHFWVFGGEINDAASFLSVRFHNGKKWLFFFFDQQMKKRNEKIK
jgi:hypothetical protein